MCGYDTKKASKYPKLRADMGIAGEKATKYPKPRANMGITRKKRPNTQNLELTWVLQAKR